MTIHNPLHNTVRIRPAAHRPLPTPSDDIQQKNRQPIFADVETRLKMTFHSPRKKHSLTRRIRAPLSKTPLLFFHYENVFPKKGKTISIQTHPNLIISRREALPMSRLRKQLNHEFTMSTKKATNPMPRLCVLCALRG